MFFKKKEKKKRLKKLTSVAFMMAIPANFLLGSFFLLTSANTIADGNHRLGISILFVVCCAGTLLLMRTLSLPRLRVFLHETKHAVLVLLSGNKMKGFQVQEREGNVEFEIYENRLQYGPFITLAPYCLPLFTLPAFLFGIIVDTDPLWSLVAAGMLGAAIGVDFETAFHDLHPQQTDFKQIVGGFPASALYIASVLYFVGNACALLVLGGRDGFGDAAVLTVRIGVRFAGQIPMILRHLARQ